MTDVLVIAQTVLTACLAAWMITGVYDNWRHPDLNRASVEMVVRFQLMSTEYPEDYAYLKHRKIENPKIIRALFQFLVLYESMAAIVLSAGSVLMVAGLAGAADIEFAREVAMIGALIFTTNWVGFLVGGNYFAYWYCHFEAQATHFMLLLWGLGVIILLTLE